MYGFISEQQIAAGAVLHLVAMGATAALHSAIVTEGHQHALPKAEQNALLGLLDHTKPKCLQCHSLERERSISLDSVGSPTGSWFIVGDILALWGERKDRRLHQRTTVRVITPILYGVSIVAVLMGIALWLSAFDLIVRRGQAVFVLGLITLLAFAAVEFLFFIGLMSQQARDQ